MRFGIWSQASVFILFAAVVSPSLGQPSDDRFPSGATPGSRASQPAQKAKAAPAKKAGAAKKEGAKAIKHPAKDTKPRESEKPPAKAVAPLPVPQPTRNTSPSTAPVAPAVGPAAAPPKQAAPSPPPPNKADETFATCLACHGSGGQSETAEIPSIAAQPRPFVIKQLTLFRDGKRKSPLMDSVIGLLGEDNARRYADLIEKLPKPGAPTTGFDATRYEQGKSLATTANCANCHNTDFGGAGDNPRLAHQREDYLIKALRDYKTTARPDESSLMSASVKSLDDAQLGALAHYLAYLK